MTEWKSTGAAPNDRASAEVAASIVDDLLPNDDFRAFALERMGDFIHQAAEVAKECWSITLFQRRVRLNIGNSWMMDIGPQAIRIGVVIEELPEALREECKDKLGHWGRSTIDYLELEHGDYDVWTSAKGAAQRWLESIAKGRANYARSHSPGMARLLEQRLNTSLDDSWQVAHSAPATLKPDRRSKLVQLLNESFAEFDYDEHLKYARETRVEGKENFREVIEARKRGDDITDLVLEKLLPHVDTAFTRETERWVSIAPAINQDVKTWYENSGWVDPDEWPTVARTILAFVETALEDGVEEACEQLVAADIKGFQTGVLTPILNAVAPERFAIANAKPVRMLDYFTTGSYSSDIGEYPRINDAIHQFAGFTVDLLTDEELPDATPLEIVDTFAHWLVSVKKYPLESKKLRYVKISPGAGGTFWDECRKQGFIAIGWGDLGDLSGLSRTEFEARQEEVLEDHPDWTKTALWQVWRVARLRPGDKVVANRGITEVLGFGTVSGEYYYDDTAESLPHRLQVEWDDTRPRRVDRGGWRRTVVKLDREEWQELLDAPLASETPKPIEPPVDITEVETGEPSEPTNVIFYGPPGTGKTYLTTRRTVELCLRPDPDEAILQDEVVTEFRKLREKGQIEFVTFHQSYGYEEFVEGIRPTTDSEESGDVQFRYEDGLFKRIALHAAAEGVRNTPVEPPFDLLWAEFAARIGEAEEAEGYELATAPNQREYALTVTRQNNIRAYQVERENGERVVRDNYLQALKKYARALWKHRDDLGNSLEDYTYKEVSRVVANELGTGGGCHGNIQWLAHLELLSLAETARNVEQDDLDTGGRLALLGELLRDGKTEELNYDGATQYVLIVDEINRGNISKILGELITLLEPSKRLTMADEMIVRLPYTKQAFGVPPNLHVIGTMNTADRSIALMDVALRRRFEFEEMMPDTRVLVSALAENVPAGVHDGKKDFINLVAALFDCLNSRIRFLYDEDHQLGHSYFMTATSYTELRATLLSNVIPMLQEYFYGSWDRVCATLGCPYSEGEPARGELIEGGQYRAPFIESTMVGETQLLGFDHLDFEDTPEFHINREWLEDGKPARLKRMCIDALSGEFARNYADGAYYP